MVDFMCDNKPNGNVGESNNVDLTHDNDEPKGHTRQDGDGVGFRWVIKEQSEKVSSSGRIGYGKIA